MIIPLHVTTRGLLSNNLPLGIVSDGLLSFGVSPPVIPPVRGAGAGAGGGKLIGWEPVRKVSRRDKILKDDAELLELIQTIVPFL